MSKTLKVLGEYAVLKVKDVAGTPMMRGFYRDAVVPNVDDDSAQHHINIGLAEEYDGPPVVAEAPADLETAPEPADEAPKGNASREDWAAYAASKGAPEEDTRPIEDGGLKQTELREKYGN